MAMDIDRLEIIVEAEAKKANAELDKLISKLNQVSSAMRGVYGLSLGKGSSASSISGTASSLSKYTKSMSSVISGTRSLTASLSRMAFGFYTLKRAIDFMGGSIKKSMNYVETVNLFQTSFKKIGMETAVENGDSWGSASADAFAKTFIDKAQTFNDKIVKSLSLDPELMMRYQAVFAQMSNSMGLVSNSAINISDSLTLLGVDLSSLFNIDLDVAMTKLQSGLAGQIRPLRQLGIDISQTSLQMTALKYGIQDNVINMSQAAKVQLRWLSIMDQAEIAFGDMAKTIDSPANQLRILSQQWTNLSRSIGNVFLPIATAILPYINALVIALRRMMDTLASAMGYDIPDYSNSTLYADVTTDIDGMTDAADDATEANEKLKKSIMGFDELNILQDNSSSASADKTGSGYGVLDDAIQKKTEAYMSRFNEMLNGMSNKANVLADGITRFFEQVSQDSEPSIKALQRLWNDGLSKVVGFTAQGAIDFYNNFLAPVGKWTLGKAIPDLANALNNLLDAVQWDSLSKALGNLFTALSKMTTGIGQGLVDFIVGFSGSLTPAVGSTSKVLADSIQAIADSLNGVDTQTWNDAGKAIGAIATALAGIKIVSGLPAFLVSVSNGLSNIALGLSNLAYMNPVALPALFDTLGLDNWVNALYMKLPQWCRDMWTGFWNVVTQMFKDIFNYSYLFTLSQSFVDTWKKVFNPGKDQWYQIALNIVKGLGQGLLIAVDAIFEPINDLFASIVQHFKDVFGIHSPASTMVPIGKYITQGLLKGITDGWDDKWKDFKSWLSDIPKKMANAIGDLSDIGKNAIKSFISGLTSIHIDLPHIEIGSNTIATILGKDIKVPSFNVKWYATGGYPTPGQLFVANEPGNPELIGNVGGRTAVVNNNQIVESVSKGVYEAVSAAMANSYGNGKQVIENKMYLENQVVYRSYNTAKSSVNGRYSPVMQGE